MQILPSLNYRQEKGQRKKGWSEKEFEERIVNRRGLSTQVNPVELISGAKRSRVASLAGK